MIQELLYTSAPRGLRPGSKGFCTVLSSAGMSAPVATALEALSGYRPVYPPGDPNAALNPVVYSHLLYPLGGKRQSVLSRVAEYGLDYSQRTNKIAHHVAIDFSDRPPAGPAWLLQAPGIMRTEWDGELKVVSTERAVPQGTTQLSICSAWKEMTGDAGWAGVLAESFLKDPDRQAYLLFEPGMELLPLIAEAVALLPEERRWEVTFSTYFTKLPKGATCNWRCVLADSPEANESRRHVQALRINLCEPLGTASGGDLVEAARTGTMPAQTEAVRERTVAAVPPPIAAVEEDGPIRLRPAAAGIPPAPPRPGFNTGPARRRRKSRSIGRALWGMALLVMIAASVGVYVVTHRPNESTEKAIAQAASKEASAPATAPVTKPKPRESNEPVTARGASGARQPVTKPKPPESDEPAPAENQAGEGKPPLSGPTNGSEQSIDGSQGRKPDSDPAASAPANHVDERQTNRSKRNHDWPQFLYWDLYADASKMDRKETCTIELPFDANPKATTITVWIPEDQGKTYRSEGASVKTKEIGLDVVSGSDQWLEYFSLEVNPGENHTLLTLTPSMPIAVEKIDRFVVEMSGDRARQHCTILFHGRPKLPDGQDPPSYIFPVTFPPRTENEAPGGHRVGSLTLVSGGERLMYGTDPNCADAGDLRIDHEASSIRFQLSVAAKPLVDANLGSSAYLQSFDHKVGHLQVSVSVMKHEPVQRGLTASGPDAKNGAISIPQLQVKLNKIDLLQFEAALAKCAKPHLRKVTRPPQFETMALKNEIGKTKFKDTKFEGTNIKDVLSSGFKSSVVTALDNLTTIDKIIGEIMVGEDQKGSLSNDKTKVDNRRTLLEELQRFSSTAIKMRDAVRNAELVEFTILQLAVANGGLDRERTEYVPLLVYSKEQDAEPHEKNREKNKGSM